MHHSTSPRSFPSATARTHPPGAIRLPAMRDDVRHRQSRAGTGRPPRRGCTPDTTTLCEVVDPVQTPVSLYVKHKNTFSETRSGPTHAHLSPARDGHIRPQPELRWRDGTTCRSTRTLAQRSVCTCGMARARRNVNYTLPDVFAHVFIPATRREMVVSHCLLSAGGRSRSCQRCGRVLAVSSFLWH